VELIYIMIKLLPECSNCGSPVTDSLETEIEQHGKVKTGRYTDGIWMCHDCIESEEGKKKGKGADDISPSIDRCDTIGVASASDVSPNTPRADET
jgi:ribosomal protein L37AE/L43A